jgi:hypothetical protein
VGSLAELSPNYGQERRRARSRFNPTGATGLGRQQSTSDWRCRQSKNPVVRQRRQGGRSSRRGPRPYVHRVKHLGVRPTACPIRGLRRIGRRRASDMGDGPDARYHLRGNGCPQSDDFNRSCRWGARWRSTPSRQFSEPRRSRRQACRAPEQDWRSATAVLLRSRPVRLWVASANHGSWP